MYSSKRMKVECDTKLGTFNDFVSDIIYKEFSEQRSCLEDMVIENQNTCRQQDPKSCGDSLPSDVLNFVLDRQSACTQQEPNIYTGGNWGQGYQNASTEQDPNSCGDSLPSDVLNFVLDRQSACTQQEPNIYTSDNNTFSASKQGARLDCVYSATPLNPYIAGFYEPAR